MSRNGSQRPRVLIAGSGVASVEAVLALRELGGRLFDVDLLAPRHALLHRAASVATPFGLGAPPPLNLHHVADRYDVGLVEGELAGVDVLARAIRLVGGGERSYDFLFVGVGAHPVGAIGGALTFRGPVDVPRVEWLLDKAAAGRIRRLAVAVPSGAAWTLPAYELAVMAATELRMRGVAEAVTVVTAEREPLWLFGAAAGRALRELLADRGVLLRTGARATRAGEGVLWLESGEPLHVDAVVALPVFEGPRVPGLPADEGGFIPTDAYGHVNGAERVLAAGDATSFPIKQGGLAAQQADAAAASIAKALGAAVEPRPFTPVLRGLLLTGGAPLYLRAELERSGAPRARTPQRRTLRGDVSARALWWPPGKIAGRYLAPYLATARPVALGDEPLADRVAGATPHDPRAHEAALDLTLMLADEDAAAGDLAQALHALDAAAALSGGVLPAAYAERREHWRAALGAVGSRR